MAHTQTYDNLTLITLDPWQHKQTCNYWYVVQNNHGPHIAFTKRKHLLQWLERLGLELTAELPPRGVWSWASLKGAYRTAVHLDRAEFNALQGFQTRALMNGRYVPAIITTDPDGLRTQHQFNPNVPDQIVFDYAESRALVG